MNAKAVFLSVLSVGIAVSAASCGGIFSRPNYTESRTFDLRLPSPVGNLNCDVEVQPFVTDSAGRFKMFSRIGNQVVADEFNRWALTPAAMITRSLRLAFADDGAPDRPGCDRRYRLSGSVLAFEADLNEKVCRLYIRYKITGQDDDKELRDGIIMIREPLREGSDLPSAIAFSMNQAADQLIERIRSVFAELNASYKPDNPRAK